MAAYLNSLAWIVTKSTTYSKRAIEFMNAWASTLKAHTNSNAPLQACFQGWADVDLAKFEDMLRDIYLPQVIVGAPGYNGNWELIMMEAAMGISIFLDDHESYDVAMVRFLDRAAAYIYLESTASDGDMPHTAAVDAKWLKTNGDIIEFWNNQSIFNVSGLSQETCRDFEHTGYGLAAMSHVAETSRIQGRDLYKEDTGSRLRYGLEFHSKYTLGALQPEWLCNNETLSTYLGPATEIGFNALPHRLGYAMPSTEELTEKQRPSGALLFYGWETLTHLRN
ncbi:unnamed protein product [Clonostachys rosea f. rosea IK726]|uniref:Uncharacterized protein n=1 Tax=Clonostachys rosea f. rosea IK726 TaxID=1349383 RepID=A0ACA9UTC5_BIOOC|nr:unnamed protein product [Clonostachys rosea f. rosea IK726]